MLAHFGNSAGHVHLKAQVFGFGFDGHTQCSSQCQTALLSYATSGFLLDAEQSNIQVKRCLNERYLPGSQRVLEQSRHLNGLRLHVQPIGRVEDIDTE